MSNTAFDPNDKHLAEKRLMEELERGERSGEEKGYLDIDESKVRIGI